MENSTVVELFLSQLKQKAKQFGIAYRDRERNLQGLADLEIRPLQREEVILNLTLEDYNSGPRKDNHDSSGPDYFVFGRTLPNGKEAYIKVTIGQLNKPVQCWSFHPAKDSMNYPFKVRKKQIEKKLK